MSEQQISTSVLFSAFLGLTERQIDANPPFGTALMKMGKQNLDCNMQQISYALSQTQYFEVIIDNDQEGIVTSQKTYWTDIEYYYQFMKTKSIPHLKCGYSDGYYVLAPQFGQILFELIFLFGKPRCIMTSI